MKRADSSAETPDFGTHTTLFASGQRIGDRKIQEDVVSHFADECFVVADGVGGMPHGECASRLAADTAVWAYEHIRRRKFYWADKKLFLRRIFKTVNLALWQKRREKGFEDGLATTLTVSIAGPRNLWVANIGDSAAYLYRAGVFAKLTDDDIDSFGYLTKAMGIVRSGFAPQITVERFIPGDVLLLASDGITTFVSERKIQSLIGETGDTKESLDSTLSKLLDMAVQCGSKDNMSAILVRRTTLSHSAS